MPIPGILTGYHCINAEYLHEQTCKFWGINVKIPGKASTSSYRERERDRETGIMSALSGRNYMNGFVSVYVLAARVV